MTGSFIYLRTDRLKELASQLVHKPNRATQPEPSMTMTNADTNPTDTEQDVQEVRLTDGTVSDWSDPHDFMSLLRSLDRGVDAIEELKGEVEDLNTGLEEEDCIRLIYGRTQFSLSDVRGFFDTLDTIEGADERKLLKRLLADLGNERLEDADEFLNEVERLRQRYGDLAEADDDGGDA